MAYIALEGMRFHSFHGVYEAERILGTTYIVDVYIQTAQNNMAAATDDLSNALNYETVYMVCRSEMEKPRHLIEAVVGSILKRMKHQFATMTSLKVRIKKQNPALGGIVGASVYEEEEQYLATCPRCNRPFVNYQPGDCWARVPNLYSGTRETIERQFGGRCLCDNCLKFFAG
jgi:7,8-dihydroneopterin aldolase/epimerase/oxygenase